MIKSLSKPDILVTPFNAQKKWVVDNLDPSDLIVWMSQSIDPITGITSSLTGSVSLTYIDYGDNSAQYPITNSYCDIALQQQENGYITYQKGVYNPYLIYPTASNISSTPKNLDGTYMNLVYAQNQQMYYNTFNNFTQTFGMESADLSTTNRTITDTMDVFSIPQNKFGDKIVPNTVIITDNSLDKTYNIIDDGNCNLIFSGSVFSVIETDNLLNSISQNLKVQLSSFDSTGSINYQFSNLLFHTVGDISEVNSSIISANISGGIAPYTIMWYIGGDFKDSWTLSSNGQPSVIVGYNTIVSPTAPLYYENTYVVCSVIDVNDNQTFSNLMYLSSGSIPFVPPTETGSLTSNSFVSPTPPSINTFLHLASTGKNVSENSVGNLIDTNYVLYNYIPNDNVTSSIVGVPSGISPFSSSYVGVKSNSWYSPDTSLANWIGPVPQTAQLYGYSYAGNYTYRIYFDLVSPNNIAINPSNFSLNGAWSVADTASLLINGIDTGNYLSGSSNSLSPFYITGGFVQGRNYLDFNIQSAWPSGSSVYSTLANPLGLLVEFDQSNPLFVTHTAPTITSQSNNVTVNLGSPINLNVSVSGDQPIVYQWYFDNTLIPNETGNTYNKIFSLNSDAGIYTLSASNAYGSIVSQNIGVNVITNPPVITQQIQYSYAGGNLTVSIAATGEEPLQYTWYFNGTNIGNNSPTLFIANALPSNVGNYTVNVSNAGGNVFSDTVFVSFGAVIKMEYINQGLPSVYIYTSYPVNTPLNYIATLNINDSVHNAAIPNTDVNLITKYILSSYNLSNVSSTNMWYENQLTSQNYSVSVSKLPGITGGPQGANWAYYYIFRISTSSIFVQPDVLIFANKGTISD